MKHRLAGHACKLLLVTSLLALHSGSSATDNPQATLTFGIVPQQSAATLAKIWIPLLEYLSNRTGIQITFDTTADIPSFEHALAAGKYDLAYMNPYHYVSYSKQPGYRAFSKARGKKITGIIVVHKDSPIRSMDELAGMEIAFPSPFAFAATMLPQNYFAAKNINITPVYVKSHDSVYRNVASGRLQAGGGVVRTFVSTNKTVNDKLRILWTSEGYTPHAFAAHPRVPQKAIDSILNAMSGLNDANGHSILELINIDGFEAANDRDWDDVRSLKLHIEAQH